MLAVRVLAAALPPGDPARMAELMEEIARDDLYEALAAGLLTLFGGAPADLSARTNRSSHQVLRAHAERHLAPGHEHLVPPDPPLGDGPRTHPGFESVTAFAKDVGSI